MAEDGVEEGELKDVHGQGEDGHDEDYLAMGVEPGSTRHGRMESQRKPGRSEGRASGGEKVKGVEPAQDPGYVKDGKTKKRQQERAYLVQRERHRTYHEPNRKMPGIMAKMTTTDPFITSSADTNTADCLACSIVIITPHPRVSPRQTYRRRGEVKDGLTQQLPFLPSLYTPISQPSSSIFSTSTHLASLSR